MHSTPINQERGVPAEIHQPRGPQVAKAPAQGDDRRRNLPRAMFERRPARFAIKFSFALTLIAGGWLVIASAHDPFVVAAAIAVLGLMYAHLVELQHECIHDHAFRSRRLNRMCGFICGVFMLSSHSHYKYEHLRHHATLGKPDNNEFFNYRMRHLDSLLGFARAALHPGRYRDVATDMLRSLSGRSIPGIARDRARRTIQTEYRIFAVLVAGGIAYTVVTAEFVVLLAWLVPLLLVAEATHFLIELPEHFGLNTQTNPNVLSNTRTIEASRFAQWFTNYNNMHTAHHFHQGIPMANVLELQGAIAADIQARERSYPTFYRKVLRGEIRCPDPAATCMTR
jgi:fatty acid desaturase